MLAVQMLAIANAFLAPFPTSPHHRTPPPPPPPPPPQQTVAGGRGYYLMNEGCLLNQALVSYAMAFLFKRGYTPVQTPFFMRKTIMAQCAQLSQVKGVGGVNE